MKYVKPLMMFNDTYAESVYMASGCYDVSAYIHQTPENGRETYVIQVNGKHKADPGHTCNGQILTLSFNQPVTYVSSQGSLVGGDGTSTIQIKYSYFNNASDNIGLGDISVKAGDGLAITGWILDDDGYRQ